MKRYLVQTFGCQMNVHDSRRMEQVLGGLGYESTDDPSLADLLIVNTCSVREKAVHKLMSLLGRIRPFKVQRPSMTLVVAGCVAQQEGEALLKRAPFVDLVMGPDNIAELPAMLRALEGGAPPHARTVFDHEDPKFLVATPRPGQPEVSSFVTVMKGCDERCTYCIVPYTRGSERYRSADAIVGEVEQAVAGGVREITLLGQTVNSWHEGPDESESQFAALLRRISTEVPDLARLRYTSPHPRHLTDALIAAHAELDVLATHVHLPVQSGSNRVLKRMLRRYTRERYLERAAVLQASKPGLTLSTDMIVGFPGETEEDFQQTLSLVREAGFVAAFGFKYSPRPNTPALQLGDDVSESIKEERLARFFEVVETQQQEHLDSLVGTVVDVLVEGRSKTQHWSGRSQRNEIVHLEMQASGDFTGQRIGATVTKANRHSLHALVKPKDIPSCDPSERAGACVARGSRRLPLFPETVH